MAIYDSVLAKIHVFSPEIDTGIPPNIFLERTRTIKSIADILHTSLLTLLYPDNNDTQKLEILMTDSIDTSIPPSEHAILIHTYDDILSLSSSKNQEYLKEVRHSILSFLQDVRDVMDLLSNHSNPDLVVIVHDSTIYLDDKTLGHPNPLVIDTVNQIRSIGKRSRTEIHISVFSDNDQEVQLKISIPAKSKIKMATDAEGTGEYIPRGFTRSKDGKCYVLFEGEQEKVQYDIRSNNPDYHQILTEAYRYQIPLIVTYRGIRVIEAGKEYIIDRKLVSLSKSPSFRNRHSPHVSEDLEF